MKAQAHKMEPRMSLREPHMSLREPHMSLREPHMNLMELHKRLMEPHRMGDHRWWQEGDCKKAVHSQRKALHNLTRAQLFHQKDTGTRVLLKNCFIVKLSVLICMKHEGWIKRIYLPFRTRRAPALAPIIIPGVSGLGAGLGRGAECVGWGRKRRRVEEIRRRRRP